MHCSLLNNGLFFYPEEDNTSLNKPCCTFGSSIKSVSKTREISRNVNDQLKRLSIEETQSFYEDPFRKLNIKLLDKGAKPEACNSCWKHEDLGYPSMRTRLNDLKFADDSKKLKYLELNTGNLCNIQCIMCNPSDSLTTKQYFDYAHTTFPELLGNKAKKLRYAKLRGLKKTDIDSVNWDEYKHLEYLKSTGGETFYTKEYWYFLEKLIEHGIAKNITLLVVTNNTVELDETKLGIYKQFKRIKVFSSLDGIGPLCDTIRAGSKWNEVEDNIKHLIELHKQYPTQFIHTEPHSVIQFANILQLEEIVNWWEDTAINDEFKGKHYLRILDSPKWYEIGMCPDSVKQEAIKMYSNIKKLNHVVKYLESSNSEDEYNVKYTLPIFEETCRINNQDPFSSKSYEVIKNA